jgi:hypothetical protein
VTPFFLLTKVARHGVNDGKPMPVAALTDGKPQS